jgi:hypothetical protein
MSALGPPPLDSPLEQQDGRASTPWNRWLQQLWDALRADSIGQVAAIGSRAAAQAIPHATWTNVQWDTEALDTNDAFATGASAAFVAPFAGRYLISAAIHMSVTGLSGYCDLGVALNGASSPSRSLSLAHATGVGGCTVSGSSTFDLAAGDSVKIQVFQSVTGSASRNTLPDGAYCWVAIHGLAGA